MIDILAAVASPDLHQVRNGMQPVPLGAKPKRLLASALARRWSGSAVMNWLLAGWLTPLYRCRLPEGFKRVLKNSL